MIGLKTFTVLRCTPKRDGQFMIQYLDGRFPQFAGSPVALAVGSRFAFVGGVPVARAA